MTSAAGRSTTSWRSWQRPAGIHAATACWWSAPPIRRSWPRSGARRRHAAAGAGSRRAGRRCRPGSPSRTDRAGTGLIVSSSRGILYAAPGEDFASAARARAEAAGSDQRSRRRRRCDCAALPGWRSSRCLRSLAAASRGARRRRRHPPARRWPGSRLPRPAKARGSKLSGSCATSARDSPPSTKAGVAPGVASSWQRSEDGKTYTFDLRPDARWSSGHPAWSPTSWRVCVAWLFQQLHPRTRRRRRRRQRRRFRRRAQTSSSVWRS